MIRLALIDDHAIVRAGLQQYFSEQVDLTVVAEASSGREAIDIVENTPELAIVLMDIMMPEMDGYQTMGVIRQDPAYRRLPIIALTAKAMKDDQEECLAAGANDYIAKPLDVDRLLSRVRIWMPR
jgi:CheY-like chemotaxis protein